MKFANRAAMAGFAAIFAVAAFAAAADYPEKPVRVIVPNKAGGGADIIVRLVSEKLSKVLGQPVVVQNQPGAATAVGSRAANEADADGYTVLANHEAIITLAAMGRLGFDIEGLDPVAKTGGYANFLVAGAAAPFSTYPEFCAHAAANPGAISAAVQIGALSHFHVISAADACEAELNYVNVTGGGAAFRAALLGGTIDVAPMPALTARGSAKAAISPFWPSWGRSATRPFPMCKQRQNMALAPPKAISTSIGGFAMRCRKKSRTNSLRASAKPLQHWLKAAGSKNSPCRTPSFWIARRSPNGLKPR